jgi:hypothetical protein
VLVIRLVGRYLYRTTWDRISVLRIPTAVLPVRESERLKTASLIVMTQSIKMLHSIRLQLDRLGLFILWRRGFIQKLNNLISRQFKSFVYFVSSNSTFYECHFSSIFLPDIQPAQNMMYDPDAHTFFDTHKEANPHNTFISYQNMQ